MQSHQYRFGHILPSIGKGALLGDAGLLAAGLHNTSGFSDHQQSELTCNVSGSRKRIRDDDWTLVPPADAISPPISFPNSSVIAQPFVLKNGSGGTVSNTFPLLSEHIQRKFDSATASSSGRPSNATTQSSTVPLGQEILAQICNHNLEMDALVRLQNERIRLGMEDARRKHYKSLLSILEQRVVNILREKETELEDANRKNAELEEKIRHMSSENQIWFNVAKNNELLVSNLRTNLEQVLRNSAVANIGLPLTEGYGDSGETPFLADDAQSVCFENELLPPAVPLVKSSQASDASRQQVICKVCGSDDVCVLVLPCRHLCMCKDCQTKVGMCPVCNSPLNACLRVFMS